MRILPDHLDELNARIKELDNDIDNFMKPDEKKAAEAIQDIPGTGNTSAQAIISVIGTDMGRFPTLHPYHKSRQQRLCRNRNAAAAHYMDDSGAAVFPGGMFPCRKKGGFLFHLRYFSKKQRRRINQNDEIHSAVLPGLLC